ncbi:hypothetical protein [Streptomyces sp. NBC_00996]|uniref:hypothetical protein n=1 Tax=Streptomyces sp. NBC_00996 TaxID=2903710 RepID=UPI0038650D53|nr:hypothetical protein OG390_41885 [Streptomyces sp. NBC_00996]
MRWENLTVDPAGDPARDAALFGADAVTTHLFSEGGPMPGARQADKAWKAMTRSIPEESAARNQAGRAADAALFQGARVRPTSESRAEAWLLLRERTAHRLERS